MARKIFQALLFGALMMLVVNRAFGQTDAQNAYCSYVMQQAMAQSNLLRAPEALAGVSQPNTQSGPYLYWGISSSFAGFTKAKLTLAAARKNCEAYRAATDASFRIRYDLSRLEQEALRHRTELVEHAIEQLDLIIKHDLRVLEVQNLTRPMLYSVQSIRARLVTDRAKNEMKLALLYVPDMSSEVPLKQLVSEKQDREADAQKSLALLDRRTIWDVRVTAGARKEVSPFLRESLKPYGEVALSYNLGSRANQNHLAKSGAAFALWKSKQEGEIAYNARILESQILQIISVQQLELGTLREQEKEIEINLQRLVGIDTASALSFADQLNADRLVLLVDIGDLTFRLEEFRNYLQINF